MKIEIERVGAEWKRGDKIGSGSFASVYIATSAATMLPPVMAVKSAEVSDSYALASLAKEAQVLDTLQTYGGGCPYVIHYYGADYTEQQTSSQLNLLLEYASLGSLRDKIRCHGRLPETQVKHQSRCILEGLQFIHSNGYVHCDIKPDNILLLPSSTSGGVMPKIADFGHAKPVGKTLNKDRHGLKGSPFYIAPESVSPNEYEPHSDVWALGCLVLEMLTGGKAWICDPKNISLESLLNRIGYTDELPAIPDTLSMQARSFLEKCLARDPDARWTIQMLLRHPFVVGEEDDDDISMFKQVQVFSDDSRSPQGPFDSFTSFLSLDDSMLNLGSSALVQDEEYNEIHANKRRKIEYQVKECWNVGSGEDP